MKFKIIIPVLLFFLLVFSFRLPFFFNSSVLALLLSIFLINNRSINIFISIFRDKLTVLILLSFIIPFFYASCSTVLQAQYDFSFLSILASNLFYVFTSIWIGVASFSYMMNNQHYCIDDIKGDGVFESIYIINYAFLLQSLIILLAFLNPSLAKVVQGFQIPSQVEISSSYYGGGVRGLALSGGQFFNLSAAYALVCFFWVISILRAKNSLGQLITLLLFSIFFIPSITTGRTVFVGLAFSFLFLFLLVEFKYKVKIFINIALLFLIMILFSYVFFSMCESCNVSKLDSLFRFAFEFLYNFIETGSFTTSSTEKLKLMYFLPDVSTILFGDGRYSSETGRYYMATDSGYMRNILLFGAPISFLFFLYQLGLLYRIFSLFSKSFATLPNVVKGFSPPRFKFVTTTVIMLFMLTLHYKGEAVAYLVTLNAVFLFLYGFVMSSAKLKVLSKKYDRN